MVQKISSNILETIGQTPVVEIQSRLIPDGKRLLLKLENFNPNFSIKDRTALGLIKAAFQVGKLKAGGTVIESTSGNLGKSLAMLGAVYGFSTIVVVDPKVSPSALNWFRAYGAKVEMITEADLREGEGFQKARIRRVNELLEEYEGAYWPNQYDNPVNLDYHQSTTALEVAQAEVEAIFGSVSTGGHMGGIARGLQQFSPRPYVIACDIKGSAALGGPFQPYLANGVGLSWTCGNMDMSLFDGLFIGTDQQAFSMCRYIAKSCGILVGGSSGLSICGAIKWLQSSSIGSAMAIVADSGINYLDHIYSDEWISGKGIAILNEQELLNDLVPHRQVQSRRLQPECVV